MLIKFLITKPGGRAGCSLIHGYLRDRSRVTILSEQFNLCDKRFSNPQDWLSEINRVYDRPCPGRKALGCALKADIPSTPRWVELRRNISLAVPDLRVISLSRNYVRQYAASVSAMIGTDDQLPVLVDIKHMKKMFGLWDSASVGLRHIFGRHNCLRIKFEDLIQQPRRTSNLLSEFLGLGIDKGFSPALESDVLPAEIIKNFDEVKRALRETSWSGLAQ